MKIQISLIALLIFSIASHSFAQSTKEKQSETVADATNKIAEAFFAAKTVAFLGDSITYQGGFVADLESIVVANDKQPPILLNLGLPSETCSGCSEPAHPFPRPNVHERFERLLDKAKPDLIIVNYGINDGIYHPFDADRFEKYKAGINKIIEAAENSDGKLKVILVTPPPFDDHPLKAKYALQKINAESFSWKKVYENYDREVMAVYSTWLMEQKDRVVGCVDLRTPFIDALAEQRKAKPNFCFAKDGVHIDQKGHKLIAATIAQAMGLDPSKTLSDDLIRMLNQRNSIMRNSWLATIGHKRPGVFAGMPMKDATAVAEKANQNIARTIKEQKDKTAK